MDGNGSVKEVRFKLLIYTGEMKVVKRILIVKRWSRDWTEHSLEFQFVRDRFFNEHSYATGTEEIRFSEWANLVKRSGCSKPDDAVLSY